MKMKMAGSGKVPSGEYEEVSLRGSWTLCGPVKCEEFSVSGSVKGEGVTCTGEIGVSGNASFQGDIVAEQLDISGSFACSGNITASEEISCKGSAKCAGSIKCNSLSVAGALRLGADAEAEEIKIDGSINCPGLVNGEKVKITFDGVSKIGSIGGGEIIVAAKIVKKFFRKMPVVGKWIGNAQVKTAVEGDQVVLEYTDCPQVTGRTVKIGNSCQIDLVQYSETVEISPKAKVGKVEKI